MNQKQKIMQDFLEFKKTTITTEKALKIVERYTNLFINSNQKPLSKFQESDLIKFFNYLDENYSVGTTNDIKVMAKVFIKWYYPDWSLRFRNLDKLCKSKNKESKYSPDDMLKKEDIEKLVQAEQEPRWKAFWLLFFYGGFRPSEVCRLKWSDITFSDDEAFVTLKATKNGKTFEKYIPENAVFYLRKIQNNNSIYVFPTKRKHKNTTKKGKEKIKLSDLPQTRSGVYQHLRDISPSVFGKRINPYILRHSVATILYNKENLKDDDVAQQLGHSTNMKQVYSHPTKKVIREKMKKLFIKAEDLPPEKKIELEKEIENLKRAVYGLCEGFEVFANPKLKSRDRIIKTLKIVKGLENETKVKGFE